MRIRTISFAIIGAVLSFSATHVRAQTIDNVLATWETSDLSRADVEIPKSEQDLRVALRGQSAAFSPAIDVIVKDVLTKDESHRISGSRILGGIAPYWVSSNTKIDIEKLYELYLRENRYLIKLLLDRALANGAGSYNDIRDKLLPDSAGDRPLEQLSEFSSVMDDFAKEMPKSEFAARVPMMKAQAEIRAWDVTGRRSDDLLKQAEQAFNSAIDSAIDFQRFQTSSFAYGRQYVWLNDMIYQRAVVRLVLNDSEGVKKDIEFLRRLRVENPYGFALKDAFGNACTDQIYVYRVFPIVSEIFPVVQKSLSSDILEDSLIRANEELSKPDAESLTISSRLSRVAGTLNSVENNDNRVVFSSVQDRAVADKAADLYTTMVEAFLKKRSIPSDGVMATKLSRLKFVVRPPNIGGWFSVEPDRMLSDSEVKVLRDNAGAIGLPTNSFVVRTPAC